MTFVDAPWELLPRDYFGAIEADPPWAFATWSKKNQKRAAERHYPTMSFEEIINLPVEKLAKSDCALFLWAIAPMLQDAFMVMRHWGFEYKTIAFSWAKTTKATDWSWAPKYHMGTGYWTRANLEVCLLGTRGKPKRKNRGVRQLIVASRRRHSQKPTETKERIERLVAGPYLELFAREHRAGWSSWGNQLDNA